MQRSPIFEAMGCTSIFPIARILASDSTTALEFWILGVILQRSALFETMGCTCGTAHWREKS